VAAVRDSIETPPFFWSDSHTTIGETVSSKFNLGKGLGKRIHELAMEGSPYKGNRRNLAGKGNAALPREEGSE
jgi:hypothetical protein